MYKLHIWKAAMENGLPVNDNETFEFTKKPTFDDMYPLINCDTIEILQDMIRLYLIGLLIFIVMKKVK